MKILYLDSSAWVKRYLEEDGSRVVERIFSLEHALACSALGHVEVAASIARKGRGFGFGTDEVSAHLEKLDQDWARFFRVRLIPEVLANARTLAVEQGLRGADAIHLAAAQTLGPSSSRGRVEVTMVASDLELLAAAKRRGLGVMDPTQPP